jgi:pimeloyl-ACP methyl ester carboxylesterase
MTSSTATSDRPVTIRTVGEGDDLITYDVRGDLADATSERPVLVMFGSPMDASGFGSLAARFADRPVVTFDPRGAGRNPKGTTPVTPEQHADDLHRVVTALGVGPVDLMGTSGGAVNLLAMLQVHPEVARRAVVHEPPTAIGLPDQDTLLSACRALANAYAASGRGPAMVRFMTLVMHDGPLPSDWDERPSPDPAAFGLPTEDDGDRTDPLFRNGPACNEFAVDPARFAELGDRVVVAVGVESGDTMAARGGRQVAADLGLPVTDFPSHHAGFLGGEFGQQGDPDGFAARLHEVLDR